MTEGATARVSRANLGAMPLTRVVHQESGEFANLVGEKQDNEIIKEHMQSKINDQYRWGHSVSAINYRS